MYGNEAVQLLSMLNKYEFFGEYLDMALCEKQNKEFVRMALIRKRNTDDNSQENQYFLFNSKSLEISRVRPEDLSKKFISNLYTFENERYKNKMQELLGTK